MSLRMNHFAAPCALFLVIGCANTLGINDKRVLSDEEYRYYLDTGEIPTEDTDLSAYKDGTGGTPGDGPGAPGGLDPDSNASGGDSGADVPLRPEPDPGEDLTERDPAWDGSYPVLDFNDLGYFFFEDANLMTDTLSGFARTAGMNSEYYPQEFLPEQNSPPYCMRGEVFDSVGYAALSVTTNEGSEGDVGEFFPGGGGLLVDVHNLEGAPLVLHLLTNAASGSPGVTYCTLLSNERPAFVPYGSFVQNCELGEGQSYVPGEASIQAVAISTSILTGPAPFNFCFYGMAEY